MNLSSAAEVDARALALDVGDVDPWVAARLDDGEPSLSRASGAIDRPVVTVTDGGAIRIRIGDAAASSILVPFGERRVSWTETADALVADTDVELRLGRDGALRVGGLVSSGGDGSMGGPGLLPGAILDGGAVRGWLARFALSPYAGVFGGGESVQGPDLRGRMRTIRNVETSGFSGYDLSYLGVPLLWSPEGWGIFVHAGGAVRADVGSTVGDILSLAVTGSCLDLFLIFGAPGDILRAYHRTTGRPGTMPSWALGTWMSRCSYLSERELHEMLDQAEAAGCPVDVVNVDAWQTGEALVDLACNWEVDRSRFPEGWVRRLQERGVRVCLWHNPYLPERSAAAQEARDRGLLARMPDGSPAESADIPGRLLLDMTNPDTLAWWTGKVRDLVDGEGADAMKTDFGEEVPDEAVFADGRTGIELRNEYAQLYQQATASAVRRDEGLPMFVRSGTAGSQRTPCHWVGDSAASWSGLVAALRSALALSMSGFAWVTHDAGGFWVAGSDAHLRASRSGDPGHFTADVDPELFLRWAQWGAFSPVLRFHGTGRREPFAYPAPYGDLAVQATRTRAALRGYLERSAEDSARTGLPMMRPMALAVPERPDTHDLLQYFLGERLLVAPVLRSGGLTRFWLPEGDWRTVLGGAPFAGGWHEHRFPVEDFPAFVRDGDGHLLPSHSSTTSGSMPNTQKTSTP